MATKDWRKTLDETEIFHYYNDKKEKIIRGEKLYRDAQTRFETPRWRVLVGGSIHGELLKDYLKSKSEAIAFARSYMRSH